MLPHNWLHRRNITFDNMTIGCSLVPRGEIITLVSLQPNSNSLINPLFPDAHYSERQDKPFSLQIQQLEVDLKLNGILFFAPWVKAQCSELWRRIG